LASQDDAGDDSSGHFDHGRPFRLDVVLCAGMGTGADELSIFGTLAIISFKDGVLFWTYCPHHSSGPFWTVTGCQWQRP
jgi:hypothetical protein